MVDQAYSSYAFIISNKASQYPELLGGRGSVIKLYLPSPSLMFDIFPKYLEKGA